VLGIIRKDLFWFALTACGLAPVVLLVEWLTSPAPSPVHAVLNSGLMFVQVVGAIFVVEATEERSRGYEFLSALPLRKLEIVAAKFTLVFAAIAIIAAANSLWFTGPARNGILLAALACLLLCGVIYTGVFAFGLSRIVIGMMTIGLAVNVLLTLLFRSQRGKLLGLIEGLNPFLNAPQWAIPVLITVAAYTALLLLATKPKLPNT
jgi:hypothetical protein